MTTVSTRIVTIPNLLSLFRLLLIPVFLVLLVNQVSTSGRSSCSSSRASPTSSTAIVARHFNQVSRVGQLLDPAADRLFIFSTLIGLAWTGFIPWWLAGVIFARDVLLLVLGVVLANYGYGPLPVHHLGKMGTFALLSAMPLLVLGAAFPQIDASPIRSAGRPRSGASSCTGGPACSTRSKPVA